MNYCHKADLQLLVGYNRTRGGGGGAIRAPRTPTSPRVAPGAAAEVLQVNLFLERAKTTGMPRLKLDRVQKTRFPLGN